MENWWKWLNILTCNVFMIYLWLSNRHSKLLNYQRVYIMYPLENSKSSSSNHLQMCESENMIWAYGIYIYMWYRFLCESGDIYIYIYVYVISLRLPVFGWTRARVAALSPNGRWMCQKNPMDLGDPISDRSIYIPSGKLTVSYWKWPLNWLIYPWKMLVFHSKL